MVQIKSSPRKDTSDEVLKNQEAILTMYLRTTLIMSTGLLRMA